MNDKQLQSLEPIARRRFERVEALATDHKGDYLLSVSDGAFQKIYGGPTDYFEEYPEDQPKKRGRPAQDKATRAYTIDQRIAAFLDAMPEGKRSQFVNDCLSQCISP